MSTYYYQIDNPGTIPPELFPIIASFLPLRSAPSTLYALALANRRLSSIVRPIIYSRLVLRTERDALIIIRRIESYPDIGRFVKELHILSDLTAVPHQDRRGQDVITGLSGLIATGSLPVLEALGLYLLTGWRISEGYRNVPGHGNVQQAFWRSLRINCPRLRALFLRGLTSMTLDRRFNGTTAIADGVNLLYVSSSPDLVSQICDKILANLPYLAVTLHSLTLGFTTMVHFNPSPIFALDFPRLRSLILKGFSPQEAVGAAPFFQRHSMLERLFFVRYEGRWFTQQYVLSMHRNFLPNLSFMDVRALAPILPRLVSISITYTVNGQVPYLLRAVIPSGLPNLKSLEFVHLSTAGTSYNSLAADEGTRWYETVDGWQGHADNTEDATVGNALQTFIYSISRGAPNLEELGFKSNAWGSMGLVSAVFLFS
ncbi:hypothetical protein BDN70DRAFT_948779 [Pholiota conissans]|uniref:Uncharacterized protein n=1 Tax=Pholiota conissans TaxID=109636 RepID=A0A9P5YWV7_9AGAR|nr:hypothetical protein BDN70DRAFT_948779 [Pholiota conissans]